MKKIILLLISLLLVCNAYSEETSKWKVTPQQAQSKAEIFFNNRGLAIGKRIKRSRTSLSVNTIADTLSSYYVYNAGNDQGFVIISGDSRVVDILGYSDSGYFDIDSIPDNMKAWFKGYEEAITYIDNYNVSPKYISSTLSLNNKPAISPIVTTQWSQSNPYNAQAPLYGGSHCLTGCVATAMAQAMNHARWPQLSTASIPSYITNRQIGELEGLPATTFDWNVLASGTGDSYKSEVSKLMRYCGQAVKMNYGTGASSAYSVNVAPAFFNYFGYTSAKEIERSSYSFSEWDEMIYNEIANDRAVYYSGQSTGGGHAFVIDGYDGEGLFHVNWGWGGYCDGYFKLSVLNPYSNSGYGASSSNDGYSMSQRAVIGLGAGDNLLGSKLECSSIYSNNRYLYVYYNNNSNQSMTCSYGIAILDNNGDLRQIGKETSASFTSGKSESVSYDLSTLLSTPGTYTIVPVFRRYSSESWQRTTGYNKYATVSVSSDKSITITVHPIINLTLDNLTVDGDLKLGSEQILKFTIRNKGDDYSGTIYCFLSSTNEKGKYITSGGTAIESNGKETVDLYLTPPEAGVLNLWISTDMSGNNVIGQTTITITTDQVGISELSLFNTKSEVGDRYAKTTFYLRNERDYAYGRPVYIELVDARTNEVERTYTLNDISIKAGRYSGWWVQFTGLDNSKIYNFNVYYYALASGQEKKLAGTIEVIMPEATVSTKHNLTITVSNGGHVEYLGSNISDSTNSFEIFDGSNVNLKFLADEGYMLNSLIINGSDETSSVFDDRYIITDIKIDQTINISFTPLPTLTIKQSEKGTVIIPVLKGQTKTFKISLQKGKQLVRVKFNGEDVTSQVTNDNLYITPAIIQDSIIEVIAE